MRATLSIETVEPILAVLTPVRAQDAISGSGEGVAYWWQLPPLG